MHIYMHALVLFIVEYSQVHFTENITKFKDDIFLTVQC